MTAQALWEAQAEPKPPLIVTELVREQNFGDAEGKPWTYQTYPDLTLEEQFAKGVYSVLHGRDEKFPNGECLNDVAERSRQAIGALILPHVWKAAKEGKSGEHVAIVSHGLCISELVAEVVKMDTSEKASGLGYRGLLNTAWARVTIEVKVGVFSAIKAMVMLKIYAIGCDGWCFYRHFRNKPAPSRGPRHRFQ